MIINPIGAVTATLAAQLTTPNMEVIRTSNTDSTPESSVVIVNPKKQVTNATPGYRVIGGQVFRDPPKDRRRNRRK